MSIDWAKVPSKGGTPEQWAMSAQLISDILLNTELMTKDPDLTMTTSGMKGLIARSRKSIGLYVQLMSDPRHPGAVNRQWLNDARTFIQSADAPTLEWQEPLKEIAEIIAYWRLVAQ